MPASPHVLVADDVQAREAVAAPGAEVSLAQRDPPRRRYTAPGARPPPRSSSAAAHLGMAFDSFKQVQHLVLSDQDTPGGRRYYRRADLDAWRLSGVRVPA
jgi:hypothetical protein